MKFARHRSQEDLVNITPLIDVVFILLVFFMLAGTIERPDPVQVQLPESTSEEEGDIEDLVILIGPNGEVLFEGREIYSNAQLVRNTAIWLSLRPNASVQLKADANVEADRTLEIMELLREGGATYLVLLTVGGDGGAS